VRSSQLESRNISSSREKVKDKDKDRKKTKHGLKRVHHVNIETCVGVGVHDGCVTMQMMSCVMEPS